MENKRFEYTYEAPTEHQRKEIDAIRRQYMPKQHAQNGLERLRYLDTKVKGGPTAYSLIFGVVGILIFGLGLATVLEWGKMVLGICIAVVGCVPMGLAYPIYTYVLARNKKKYGEEILRLSETLLGENVTLH